jgi:hypothetical protein
VSRTREVISTRQFPVVRSAALPRLQYRLANEALSGRTVTKRRRFRGACLERSMHPVNWLWPDWESAKTLTPRMGTHGSSRLLCRGNPSASTVKSVDGYIQMHIKKRVRIHPNAYKAPKCNIIPYDCGIGLWAMDAIIPITDSACISTASMCPIGPLGPHQ